MRVEIVKGSARELADILDPRDAQRHRLRDLVDLFSNDAGEQRGLAAEVAVDPLLIDPGTRGDPLHRGAVLAMCGKFDDGRFARKSFRALNITGHAHIVFQRHRCRWAPKSLHPEGGACGGGAWSSRQGGSSLAHTRHAPLPRAEVSARAGGDACKPHEREEQPTPTLALVYLA